jgi:hypothetical protein
MKLATVLTPKKIYFTFIVDLRLVIESKCRYEKNRCTDAIVEVISLSTSFILLIALHFRNVFILIS